MQDITKYRVVNAVAVQNHGRSGSTFLQSLLDGHPSILSTPNFYSRDFYRKWKENIASLPDDEKQRAFIDVFPIWFDTAYVDQSAGLHRLGPDQNQVAHVDKARFSRMLTAYFEHNEMTRRNFFIGAHLAYGLCLNRRLAKDLWVLFPVHGRPKDVADTFLKDFPEAKFIYTVREPSPNFASGLSHFRTSNMDYTAHPVVAKLGLQFCRTGNATNELCSDRPYREAHRTTDQAKAIRLEDLHARPEDVMYSLAKWLDITWNDCLLDSTFDGKTWWNRPESPKQSGFGGQMLNRNVKRKLSALDEFRIGTIARPHALAWGYNLPQPSHLARLWHAILFTLTIWVPWRAEWQATASPYRVVHLLAKCRRFLPISLRDQIDDRRKREKRRYTYLQFDNGVRGIRAQRPDADKSHWLQCMIVLYLDPKTNDYKGKIYEDFPVPNEKKNRDYAIVRFADELPGRPDTRKSLNTLDILSGIGRLSLFFIDYLSVRYWTARAYIQVRWEHGREVELLTIVDHAGTRVARGEKKTPAGAELPRSLSAA